jgi:thioester reductase-like protein
MAFLHPSESTYLNDISLDASICFRSAPPRRVTTDRTALLTGGTGFLGTHLLGELLRQTRMRVMCLVRADTPADGLARICQAASAYGAAAALPLERVIPVLGDLGQPFLGMEKQQFRRLGESVDVIYHNGAALSLAYPYALCRVVNVGGTSEILRLAGMGRPTPLHHISSLSVFNGSAYAVSSIVPEQFCIENGVGIDRGYPQSKWVAERLVNTAADRGLPTSIYRPGVITGHSQSGTCNVRDRFSLLLRACVLLGVAPEFDGVLHLTPVDYVARAIVELSRIDGTTGKAYHLISPRSLTWLEAVAAIRDANHVVGPCPTHSGFGYCESRRENTPNGICSHWS